MALIPTPAARPAQNRPQIAPSATPGATTIIDLKSGKAWRGQLQRAKFRDARFHTDTASRESGRRIVKHEFPKRDIPYAEDMGLRAREFTIRGYIIAYPRDGADDLQKKNYIPARDKLMKCLEQEGPGILQTPLLGSMNVAVVRFRVTEEDKNGGYCSFDMTFVEYGKAPAEGSRQSAAGVNTAADNLGNATTSGVGSGINNQANAKEVAT